MRRLVRLQQLAQLVRHQLQRLPDQSGGHGHLRRDSLRPDLQHGLHQVRRRLRGVRRCAWHGVLLRHQHLLAALPVRLQPVRRQVRGRDQSDGLRYQLHRLPRPRERGRHVPAGDVRDGVRGRRRGLQGALRDRHLHLDGAHVERQLVFSWPGRGRLGYRSRRHRLQRSGLLLPGLRRGRAGPRGRHGVRVLGAFSVWVSAAGHGRWFGEGPHRLPARQHAHGLGLERKHLGHEHDLLPRRRIGLVWRDRHARSHRFSGGMAATRLSASSMPS